MEELVKANKLVIRHYKNTNLYNAYANKRSPNDLCIIGDNMTIYGAGAVEKELNNAKNEIDSNLRRIQAAADNAVSTCSKQVEKLKSYTYSKSEIDRKEKQILAAIKRGVGEIQDGIPQSYPANGGDADTAKRLFNKRYIGLMGKVSAYSEPFDGSGDISINVTKVSDAERLTNSRQISISGDVSGSAYFDGSRNIDISVSARYAANADNAKNAQYANNSRYANSATTANSAAKLSNERLISLTGAIQGSGRFDGSDNLEIFTALAKEGGVVDGNVSNPDAWWVKLGGKFPLIIQGGKQAKSRNEAYISFSISFSQNCFSVITDLYYDGWDPGETNVWNVSRTGFNVGEQESGGFSGWYWIAVGI